ncbi:UU173 family protein [Mycoplasmopsis synoviae]|uniref:UU173 family protein n=2 Tax=Mycoplasmopsis synoviae TaxID=2109 RepID=UPI001CE17EB9|nr:DUF2779 domain-containing protein [Mycoplasmopsis synoviae]
MYNFFMQKIININLSLFKRVFLLNPALIFAKSAIEAEFQNLNKEEILLDLNSDSEQALADDEIDLGDLTLYTEFLESDDGSTKQKYFSLSKSVSDKMFKKYVELAQKWYSKKYKFKAKEIEYIGIKSTLENKINSTKEAIKDDSKKLIFNPSFSFSEEEKDLIFNFNSTAFAYDKVNKKIVLLNFSKTSKFKFYFDFFYVSNIVKKWNLDVRNFSVIIIDPFTTIKRNFKQKELLFYEAFGAAFTKTATISKNKNFSVNNKEFNYALKLTGDEIYFYESNYKDSNPRYSFFNAVNLYKSLYTNSYQIETQNFSEFENYDNYLEILNSPKLKLKKLIDTEKQNTKKPLLYNFLDFDIYINLIKKAYLIFGENLNLDAARHFFTNSQNKYVSQADKFKHLETKALEWLETKNKFNSRKKDFLNENIELTFEFDYNDSFSKEEISQLTSIFLKEKYEISANLMRLSKKGLNKLRLNDVIKSKEIFSKFENFVNPISVNLIRNLHLKDKKIIWYDYEGFSSILPVLTFTNPHQQLVNQVSIIQTINGNETYTKNLVFDTFEFKYQDLVEIIENIYSDKSDYYIVYNKAYENTRNKEIGNLVTKVLASNSEEFDEFKLWFNQKYSDVSEFLKKIEHINSNTIDLADFFTHSRIKFNSEFLENHLSVDKNLFKFFKVSENEITFYDSALKEEFLKIEKVFLTDLKYFYSIKRIEKFITKYKIELKNKIKEYKNLEIQNGYMAMNEAINRHWKTTNNATWKRISLYLKEYCENDVRAMMMLYDFLMLLFYKIDANLKNIEFNISLSESQNDFLYKYENDGYQIYYQDKLKN